MTDYNDGKWHGWNGGECPVHPDSLVVTVWKYKDDDEVRQTLNRGPARENIWEGNEHGDVIAFCVLKPHREPIVFWANVYESGLPGAVYKTKEEAENARLVGKSKTTKFVEVFEDEWPTRNDMGL